jgi:hypothetical protein
MRNFISFYSFCNYGCILKLIAPKNNNLSPFIYCTYLEIYTPSSAFFSIIHFRSLYPNRYKTSYNITLILHYLRPFKMLSVALAKQFLSSRLFIFNHHFIPFQEVRNLILSPLLRKASRKIRFFCFLPHQRP